MTIKKMTISEFIQIIGLEEEEVLKNIDELVDDYVNVSKILNEKPVNYIIFEDEVSKEDKAHLRKSYSYKGLLNNYVLGLYI